MVERLCLFLVWYHTISFLPFVPLCVLFGLIQFARIFFEMHAPQVLSAHAHSLPWGMTNDPFWFRGSHCLSEFSHKLRIAVTSTPSPRSFEAWRSRRCRYVHDHKKVKEVIATPNTKTTKYTLNRAQNKKHLSDHDENSCLRRRSTLSCSKSSDGYANAKYEHRTVVGTM